MFAVHVVFSFLVFLFFFFFFFFNDPATTEIYTLSLHDALPIFASVPTNWVYAQNGSRSLAANGWRRSEEHTSELQSLRHLVCRLLLEKKKSYTTQDSHKNTNSKKETQQPTI